MTLDKQIDEIKKEFYATDLSEKSFDLTVSLRIKSLIAKAVKNARIDENQWHLNNLSTSTARSYSVLKIRNRLAELQQTWQPLLILRGRAGRIILMSHKIIMCRLIVAPLRKNWELYLRGSLLINYKRLICSRFRCASCILVVFTIRMQNAPIEAAPKIYPHFSKLFLLFPFFDTV